MIMSRRMVLLGLGAFAAPALIRTPGLLMPVKPFFRAVKDPLCCVVEIDIEGVQTRLMEGLDYLAVRYMESTMQVWLARVQMLRPLSRTSSLHIFNRTQQHPDLMGAWLDTSTMRHA